MFLLDLAQYNDPNLALTLVFITFMRIQFREYDLYTTSLSLYDPQLS